MNGTESNFQLVLETGPVKVRSATLTAAIEAARDARTMGRHPVCIRRGSEIILEHAELRRALDR